MVFGYSGDVLNLRRAATEHNDFHEVVEFLATTRVISKCYYIVSGLRKNEGVVLTMHHQGAVDEWWFNDNYWYIVQTNYDHWSPPPIDDDRRVPAMSQLEKIGRDYIDMDKLWEILVEPPVYRPGKCVYTTAIVPATGYYYSVAHATNSTSNEVEY